MKKIAIDAGHGGKDPGALGNGLQEKDLTLRLALRIGELLVARGADVLYSRKDDRYLTLSERAAAANKAGADFFLSVHINAGGGTGFESFTYTSSTTAETAYQNVIHQKVAAVFATAGLPDRGQKKANLAVLRETKMSAVLSEYGFIDRAEDAAKLKDPAFIEKLAQATANGIAEAYGLPAAKTTGPDNKVNVFVNGNKVQDGLLIDGLTYVPVRDVAETLGAGVTWDGKSKTVNITKK